MPEYGVAFFYDTVGQFCEKRSMTLPFPPHYRFSSLSDLESLIISGLSEDELDEEMYNQMRVRQFKLEWYHTIGKTTFAYYFENED